MEKKGRVIIKNIRTGEDLKRAFKKLPIPDDLTFGLTPLLDHCRNGNNTYLVEWPFTSSMLWPYRKNLING